MATTKKLIGKLPVLLGEYDSTKTYSKKNRVTLYGSEFESLIDNNTYAPAILDSEGKTVTFDTEHWLVVSNGTGAFLAGEKLDQFSFEENPEFVSAETDSDGKLLESTDTEGKKIFYGDVEVKGEFANEHINEIIKEETSAIADIANSKVDKVDGKSLIDENVAGSFSEEENPEFIAANVDADDKVIDSIDTEGNITHNTKHIFNGGIEDTAGGLKKEALQYAIDNSSDLAKALKEGGYLFSATDWSDYISNDGDNPLHLPEPRLAFMNIIPLEEDVERLGTKDGLKALVQFWDGYGNYFKKYANIDKQGDSTQLHWKRNFAIDFFDSEYDGDAFSVAFGKWVAQDSYHVKAFYNDPIKGVNYIAYKLYNQAELNYGELADRPYKEYWTPTSTSAGSEDLDKNGALNARTISDGFPIVILLNSGFYGVFAFGLKKHRDNYLMDRNATDNIHLDGWFKADVFWSGNIKWTIANQNYEVRNPKPKSKKWTLLCQDGTEYDGDNPKELMGEDSDSYDADNKSCVNTAEVKANIQSIANYMTEIKTYEDAYTSDSTDENLATLKSEIEKRFSIKDLILYVLMINFLQDGDSVEKNWQWLTWGKVDGTLKAFVCPWDMDSSFGISSVSGFSISAPVSGGDIGRWTRTPAQLVWKYYLDDLKALYKKLRDNGILSEDNVDGLIKDWVDRVGDFYQLEYEKWDESPCQRANNISSDWTYTGKSQFFYRDGDQYYSTATYAKGDYCKVSHALYQSLQDDNKGHAVTETDWWNKLSYTEGTTYSKDDTIYDGYECFYQFKANAETTSRPFSKFYEHFPHEGGVYDSYLRICAWVKEKIALMDKDMDYSK